MKWILIMFFSTGAAPITPEHYPIISGTFDDRIACTAAADNLGQTLKRGTWKNFNAGFSCLPTSMDGWPPEYVSALLIKYPELANRNMRDGPGFRASPTKP